MGTQALKASFLIVRPFNLIIIAATTLFAMHYFQVVGGLHIYCIGLLYVGIAASGYIINDIYDLEIDTINRPTRPLPSKMLTIDAAWIWYSVWILVAMGAAIPMHTLTIVFSLLCWYLTVIYAVKMKKQGFAGNAIVAFLTASPIIAVAIEAEAAFIQLLLPAGAAFLITCMRELVKDCEDIDGDTRLQSKSIPVTKGIVFSRYCILGLTVFLACFTLAMHSFADHTVLYYGIVVGGVSLCTGIAYYYVTKNNFSRASMLYKIAMLLGIGGLWLSR